MYFVYIIKSETGLTYIGQTNNLEDRLTRHKQNRNKYTKNKGPWKLIASYEFQTRSEAIIIKMRVDLMKTSDEYME